MANDEGAPGEDDEHRGTVNLIAIIAVLVLVIAGFWLITTMRDSVKNEECLMFGLRSCARLNVPAR